MASTVKNGIDRLRKGNQLRRPVFGRIRAARIFHVGFWRRVDSIIKVEGSSNCCKTIKAFSEGITASANLAETKNLQKTRETKREPNHTKSRFFI